MIIQSNNRYRQASGFLEEFRRLRCSSAFSLSLASEIGMKQELGRRNSRSRPAIVGTGSCSQPEAVCAFPIRHCSRQRPCCFSPASNRTSPGDVSRPSGNRNCRKPLDAGPLEGLRFSELKFARNKLLKDSKSTRPEWIS